MLPPCTSILQSFSAPESSEATPQGQCASAVPKRTNSTEHRCAPTEGQGNLSGDDNAPRRLSVNNGSDRGIYTRLCCRWKRATHDSSRGNIRGGKSARWQLRHIVELLLLFSCVSLRHLVGRLLSLRHLVGPLLLFMSLAHIPYDVLGDFVEIQYACDDSESWSQAQRDTGARERGAGSEREAKAAGGILHAS
jgi:hypothetical protein